MINSERVCGKLGLHAQGQPEIVKGQEGIFL